MLTEPCFDPPGSESMTCRLQEVRPHAPSVLAAQMAPVIALTALITLGLSDPPVHEPVHGRGAQFSSPCQCANIVKSLTYFRASGLGNHKADGFQERGQFIARHRLRPAISLLGDGSPSSEIIPYPRWCTWYAMVSLRRPVRSSDRAATSSHAPSQSNG